MRPISLDLTDPQALELYRDLLENARPDVGLLANVAGFGKFGRYDQIPLADSLKMIDLNCKALVAMTELTLPYMKRGAKLLNLDSLSAPARAVSECLRLDEGLCTELYALAGA